MPGRAAARPRGPAADDPFSVGLAVGALGGVLALLAAQPLRLRGADPRQRHPGGDLSRHRHGGPAHALQPTGERLLTRVAGPAAGRAARVSPAPWAPWRSSCRSRSLLWIVRPPLVTGRLGRRHAPGRRSRDRHRGGSRPRWRWIRATSAPWSSADACGSGRGRDLEPRDDAGRAGPALVGGAAAGRRCRWRPGRSRTSRTAIRGSRPSHLPRRAGARRVDAGPARPAGRPHAIWTAALAVFLPGGRAGPERPVHPADAGDLRGAAGRRATRRSGCARPEPPSSAIPGCWPDLVDQFLPLRLDGAAVGGDGPRRGARPGRARDAAGGAAASADAAHAYRSAIEVASADQAPLIYWLRWPGSCSGRSTA